MLEGNHIVDILGLISLKLGKYHPFVFMNGCRLGLDIDNNLINFMITLHCSGSHKTYFLPLTSLTITSVHELSHISQSK